MKKRTKRKSLMRLSTIRIAFICLTLVLTLAFGGVASDVHASGLNSRMGIHWDKPHNNRPGNYYHDNKAGSGVLDLEQGGKVFYHRIARATLHTYVAPDNLVTTHVIEGPKSLVVVDTQQQESYATEIRAYIDSLGKRIDRVILSHSHPDHTGGLRFGLFDDAPIYALSDTADALEAGVFGLPPISVENVIDPGKERINGIRFEFLQFDNAEDGAQLVIILPDLDAIIVQDLAFNGDHLFLGNAVVDNSALESWIEALHTLQATKRQNLVLVGHGYPGEMGVLSDNINYLKTAIKVRARSENFDEFRETMIEKFLHLDGEFIFFYGNFGFIVPYP